MEVVVKRINLPPKNKKLGSDSISDKTVGPNYLGDKFVGSKSIADKTLFHNFTKKSPIDFV